MGFLYTFEAFLLWMIFSFLAAWIALQKGRSNAGIFFASIFLTPVVGIIVALVMDSKEQLEMKDARKTGASTNFRLCPACFEVIRKAAFKCRYCHSVLGVAPDEAVDAAPTTRAMIFRP